MANNINMGKQCRGDSQPGNACGEDRERCVLCWRETDIPKDTPVSRHKYYLEGQGQLCAKCYYELYGAGVFRHTQDTE